MSSNLVSIEGKNILLTGASSGIGYGLACGLARGGANLVAGARRIERLEELISDIQSEGGSALAVNLDVTDRDSIAAALDEAERVFGVVDVVINNAGVADARSFLKTTDDAVNFAMNTNFKGAWKVAQEAAKRMVEANAKGSIINIASILGLGAQLNQTAYASSKGAVVQLTRNMALDLGKYGIRVNAIAPGYFVTEITSEFLNSEHGQAFLSRTPARRAGEIEELVAPIAMLASDAASFVNGVVLPVDGAHSAALVS
ncbi:MAG: SDR family oxidoreductase [Pseudomonadota bacterium]